nr:MAG TPA: hypothetical protein [Caudoviricetes sp.]
MDRPEIAACPLSVPILACAGVFPPLRLRERPFLLQAGGRTRFRWEGMEAKTRRMDCHIAEPCLFISVRISDFYGRIYGEKR